MSHQLKPKQKDMTKTDMKTIVRAAFSNMVLALRAYTVKQLERMQEFTTNFQKKHLYVILKCRVFTDKDLNPTSAKDTKGFHAYVVMWDIDPVAKTKTFAHLRAAVLKQSFFDMKCEPDAPAIKADLYIPDGYTATKKRARSLEIPIKNIFDDLDVIPQIIEDKSNGVAVKYDGTGWATQPNCVAFECLDYASKFVSQLQEFKPEGADKDKDNFWGMRWTLGPDSVPYLNRQVRKTPILTKIKDLITDESTGSDVEHDVTVEELVKDYGLFLPKALVDAGIIFADQGLGFEFPISADIDENFKFDSAAEA